MSSVGSRWRSRESSRVSLPAAISLARKSAGAAAMRRTWASANSAWAASASSLGGLDVDAVDAGGLGEGDVGGDQGYVRPAAGGGGGEGNAHAAAGAVAEEADRVDRLAGAARGDEDAEAVPGALAGGQLSFDPRQQLGWVGKAALAVLAARGEGALLGLDHVDAALAQGRQVGLGRRIGVHAVVHRRRDQARRRAGEEGGGEHRVGDAGGQLGERVGRGRGDQVGVAVGGQLEVADRVVLGRAGRRGRRRAADRARTRRSGPGRRQCPRRRRRRRSGSRPRSSARARRGRPWSPGAPVRAPCRRRSLRLRRAGFWPWLSWIRQRRRRARSGTRI